MSVVTILVIIVLVLLAIYLSADRLAEGEGVARDAGLEAEGQRVAPGLGQVDEPVEALLADLATPSLTSSPASASGIGSPSSRTSHLARLAGRAEDQEDAARPGSAASIAASSPAVADSPVDVPGAAVGEVVERRASRPGRRRSRALPG